MAGKLGDRNHHLEVQEIIDPPQATDAFGTPAQKWTTTAHRYCEIKALSGREFYAAREVQADVTHKITCRSYFNAATGKRLGPVMRFRWMMSGLERIFNIESVTNLDEQYRGTDTECMCKEQV
jgi:SPP1 family predicted phage head-tail adaptor